MPHKLTGSLLMGSVHRCAPGCTAASCEHTVPSGVWQAVVTQAVPVHAHPLDWQSRGSSVKDWTFGVTRRAKDLRLHSSAALAQQLHLQQQQQTCRGKTGMPLDVSQTGRWDIVRQIGPSFLRRRPQDAA
ncbi:unnamed protein product [Polarella glacialis]|uniref:Uncharacterized protein n=1 Tax=Polarella glacialis TaxID=89957 RepID=A0A813JY83_POLGL|nr:unnamed protein product [Polarella glacialis]